MPDVLLVGAFGRGNPGDEALCRAFSVELADNDVRLLVASADPARTAADHGVDAIVDDARTVARAVRAADVVVVGGGTLFKELHRSAGRRPNALLGSTAALVAGAQVSGTKVALVGVGAADLPARSSRALARWIARGVDLLVLRDEESAAALVAAGMPGPFWIGADATWVLPAPPPVIGARPASVTVALSHLAGGPDLTVALADALAPLCADHDVALQPWQAIGGRDLHLAEDVGRRLGGRARIVDAPLDLADAGRRFAGDRLVIALRFHAIVAAARAGTRVLAVAHEPKLAGLSRRLGQLAVPAHAPADVLSAAIDAALLGEPPSPASVRGEVVAARHALDLLALLLRDGDLEEPATFRGLPLSTGMASW